MKTSNSAHEPGSGTGILPVWADRLEALFHYAKAVVVQAFNTRLMLRTQPRSAESELLNETGVTQSQVN